MNDLSTLRNVRDELIKLYRHRRYMATYEERAAAIRYISKVNDMICKTLDELDAHMDAFEHETQTR